MLIRERAYLMPLPALAERPTRPEEARLRARSGATEPTGLNPVVDADETADSHQSVSAHRESGLGGEPLFGH